MPGLTRNPIADVDIPHLPEWWRTAGSNGLNLQGQQQSSQIKKVLNFHSLSIT